MHEQIYVNLPVADLSRTASRIRRPIWELVAMDPNAPPPD